MGIVAEFPQLLEKSQVELAKVGKDFRVGEQAWTLTRHWTTSFALLVLFTPIPYINFIG